MLSKSLVIFVGIGIIAGLGYGIFLIDVKNTSQLVYVEGPGISIITEKFDFKKGEEINIIIKNTGTVPITFSDKSYGLRITGLSGILMYTPTSVQVISELKPNEEVELSWDQIKNDGDATLEGLYKISAKGFDPMGEKVERSTTVTIWK
ncbi:hypothetical protein [Nitrosopumilus sp. b2]|uniref:hypothetical protein n=1 Tax=Nitrosopumilus sp. b2 TaxID=2109908 RepID=UPI0015F6C919|nr:hypothetical protein [Nitrosopumilus sp. b2]KAF6245028.1 hypothetical protein C6989_05630 [Nitrosopumilus sp. b2]